MDDKGYGHIDFATLVWRKGSRSGGSGSDCVEVAKLPGGGVAIRDSKNPGQAPLVFNNREAAAFRHGVIEEGLLD
jgi:hypothetical protein